MGQETVVDYPGLHLLGQWEGGGSEGLLEGESQGQSRASLELVQGGRTLVGGSSGGETWMPGLRGNPEPRQWGRRKGEGGWSEEIAESAPTVSRD